MKHSLLTTTIFVSAAVGAQLFAAPVFALPTEGIVSGGSATFTEGDKRLDIHQHSDRAVIDWRTFNISIDEVTQFHQPSSSASALNRVHDINPSRIAGQLSANGNIILVNPNGVFFSGSARVDVNGIVAATADIRTEDFMGGSNHFDITGNPNAAIINDGLITAKEAGLVGLVAPYVENNGIIQARMGRIQLAAADVMTLDFYGDGLLSIAVEDEAVKEQIIVNNGVLSADGGVVAMTAAQAGHAVDSLIVAGGIIGAQTVEEKDGYIIIGAPEDDGRDGDHYVAVTGILDASGRDEGERGGTIEVLGDYIAITETAGLDASGHSAIDPDREDGTGTATMREDRGIDNGVRTEDDFWAQDSRAGGSIKIGGDYLGKGDAYTATTVVVDDGALILNDAVQSGDAGRTIVWSDGITEFKGSIYSRGGIEGGHGGFVETSGKIDLSPKAMPTLQAGQKATIKELTYWILRILLFTGMSIQHLLAQIRALI